MLSQLTHLAVIRLIPATPRAHGGDLPGTGGTGYRIDKEGNACIF
jgi:hypothetical protein